MRLVSLAPGHFLGFAKGLEPRVDLGRGAAIGRNLDSIVFDINVALKGAGALGVGNVDGGIPTVIFMAGKPDGNMRIAVAQEIDLVHFQIAVLGGIEGNAMIEGEGNVAVLKKGDQIVNVLQGGTAGGSDDRFASLGDLLDQEPIVQVGTGQLDDLHAQRHAQIHGTFIERSGAGQHARFANGRNQSGVIVRGQRGLQGLFDVTDVRTLAIIRMDQCVHIAQLDFDGGADVVEPDDLAELVHNRQTSLQLAQMVVGHLQHK